MGDPSSDRKRFKKDRTYLAKDRIVNGYLFYAETVYFQARTVYFDQKTISNQMIARKNEIEFRKKEKIHRFVKNYNKTQSPLKILLSDNFFPKILADDFRRYSVRSKSKSSISTPSNRLHPR